MRVIRKTLALSVVALLAAFLAACTIPPEPEGVYKVQRVDLVTTTKTVDNFESCKDNAYELRLEPSGKATVSFIYLTDSMGQGDYYATPSPANVTTWRQVGDKIFIEGGVVGVGNLDLTLHEGWIHMYYVIKGERIYLATFEKTS